uniref:Chromo domain-containing protein n=1 Tax=Ananas comosus var. bracteatus TaxID=296719 RepID=A0A6V7PVZ5_ANACO|nr:unnamed protein product [Ananas comosus var. bracteatus]
MERKNVELREDLSFEEQPVKVLAREVKKLRNRDIPYVKVLWSNHGEREATWELESALQERYPIFSDGALSLFEDQPSTLEDFGAWFGASKRLDWKDSNSRLEIERASFAIGEFSLTLA